MRVTRRAFFLLSLVGFLPVAFFIVFALRTNLFGDNVWLAFGTFLLLTSALFWPLSLRWWRSLDDVHQEGHLGSWYHGGFYGALAFVLWIVANEKQVTDYWSGAIHMFAAQVATALAVYLWWKWRGNSLSAGKSE